MTERPEKTKVPRKLAAILAADIAGYSALMGADEADTVPSLKEHQAVVLPMIKGHDGRIIDTAGDGILAEFGSVVNAAECAVAIQQTMAERNADVEEARRMRFRIGINQGDVVFEDTRVYGDGVKASQSPAAFASPARCMKTSAARCSLRLWTSASSNLRTLRSLSASTESRANSSRLRKRPQSQAFLSLTSLQSRCFLSRT
jgi:class 3 adenylate cyclase